MERAMLVIAWSEAMHQLAPLSKVLSEGGLRESDSFLQAWRRLKDAAETSARLYRALATHVDKHGCLPAPGCEFTHRPSQQDGLRASV